VAVDGFRTLRRCHALFHPIALWDNGISLELPPGEKATNGPDTIYGEGGNDYLDGWKGDDTLIIASRQKALARRLRVPGVHLGEVRHILREKIGEHAIEFEAGPGLHLGTRDTRESV